MDVAVICLISLTNFLFVSYSWLLVCDFTVLQTVFSFFFKILDSMEVSPQQQLQFQFLAEQPRAADSFAVKGLKQAFA